jgi:hypothetical protein
VAAQGGTTKLPRAWPGLVQRAAEDIRDDLRRVDDDICRRVLPVVLDRLGVVVRDFGGLDDSPVVGGTHPDAVTSAEAIERLESVARRIDELDTDLRKALAGGQHQVEGHALWHLYRRLNEIRDQAKAPVLEGIADLEDIRRHGYPLGIDPSWSPPSPRGVRWASRLERANLAEQLGVGDVRSHDREVKVPPDETAGAPGHSVTGSRFVARLDRDRAGDLAVAARREPWALRAGGGPLGLLDPAGGPDTIAELKKRHSFWARLRRFIFRTGEKTAVGQAKKHGAEAATALAVAAGASGAVLAATPLAVAGLVGLSPRAIRYVVRALKDEAGPDDRRAWVPGQGHVRSALYQAWENLHPAGHREQWEPELVRLRELGLQAIDARHARGGGGGDDAYLRARRELYAAHAEAVRWCRARQYPQTNHQLLLFDGGPEQLAEVLWQQVTA